MSVQRIAVDPVFQEDDAIRILDVLVHRMEQATRLEPRSTYVLQTEPQHFVERIGSSLH